MKFTNNQQGISLLVSVLTIGLLGFSISLTMSLINLDFLENTLSMRESSKIYYVAESCFDEVLFRLKNDFFVDSVLTFENHQCEVNLQVLNGVKKLKVMIQSNQIYRGIKGDIYVSDKGIIKIKNKQEI